MIITVLNGEINSCQLGTAAFKNQAERGKSRMNNRKISVLERKRNMLIFKLEELLWPLAF